MKTQNILIALLFVLAPLVTTGTAADHGGLLEDPLGLPLADDALCGDLGGDPIHEAMCAAAMAVGTAGTVTVATDENGPLDFDQDGRNDLALIHFGHIAEDYVVFQLDYLYTPDDASNPFHGEENGASFDYPVTPMVYTGWGFGTGIVEVNSGNNHRLSTLFSHDDQARYGAETFSLALYNADTGLCYACIAPDDTAPAVVFGNGVLSEGRVQLFPPAEPTEGDDYPHTWENGETYLFFDAPGTAQFGHSTVDGQANSLLFPFPDGRRASADDLHFKIQAIPDAGFSDLDDDGDYDTVELLNCGSNPTNKASTCEDLDGDGRTNSEEADDGTDPRFPEPDSDGDGVIDALDNCPADANRDQEENWDSADSGPGLDEDRDGNGIVDGDACRDLDGDGIIDLDETPLYGTDYLDADSDDDGLPDGIEVGLKADRTPVGANHNPTDPLDADSDGDGLLDGEEDLNKNGIYNGNDAGGETNPNSGDSDGDGLNDFQEVKGLDANDVEHGFGPTHGWEPDSDGDGLTDLEEITGTQNPYCTLEAPDPATSTVDNTVAESACTAGAPTHPKNADSDGDGLDDGEETGGYSVSTPDGDLSNVQTDPWNADTDNDGFSDGQEATGDLIVVSVPVVGAVTIGDDPLGQGRSDPRDPDSVPQDNTPLPDPDAVPTPVVLLNMVLFAECRAEGEKPEFCEDDATDRRDLRNTDDDDETTGSNGQMDLVEERLFYTKPTDGVLDLYVVQPRTSLGTLPPVYLRIHVGDPDPTDETSINAFIWLGSIRDQTEDPNDFFVEDMGPFICFYDDEAPGATSPIAVGSGQTIEEACADRTTPWKDVTDIGFFPNAFFMHDDAELRPVVGFTDEDENGIPESMTINIIDPSSCDDDLFCHDYIVSEDIPLEGIPEPPGLPGDPDEDEDGVPDEDDACPNTPPGEQADEFGCSDSQTAPDADGDGVPDHSDACPDTASGAAVDENGCSDEQNSSPDCGGIDAPELGCIDPGAGPDPNELCEEDQTFPECLLTGNPAEGCLDDDDTTECVLDDLPAGVSSCEEAEGDLYVCTGPDGTTVGQVLLGEETWPGLEVRLPILGRFWI